MLAATPPMGWNSWNMFGAHVSAAVVKQTADALVSTGLRDAGYRYVVIDDCWHGGRDELGRLYPCPERFPKGMPALADYIHTRGLKFGLYSDAGTKTCAGKPASQDCEEVDAQTFAGWGVDYLKYDWCYAEDTRANAEYRFGKMSAALRATGRDIVFSICEWGHHRPWLWGAKAGGQLWRSSTDIFDCWHDASSNHHGVEIIGFEKQRGLEAFAGPGHWNDPDMLVVGLYGKSRQIPGEGCTDTQYRTHFSLWCLLAAPLMIGCDVSQMNAATRDILLNREVIALDQDPLGQQGYFVCRNNLKEVWKKPLTSDCLAVGLFNREPRTAQITAHWSDLEISGAYAVRDLWAHADLGVYSDKFAATVEPHGCVLLRLTPAGRGNA
jgi:alpha-galactosidase